MCDENEARQETERERARQMSPAALAFLGDAVYELQVRAHFVESGHLPADELHRRSVTLANAGFQAKAAAELLSVLTEDERGVLRRGRNLNAPHVPKNASPAAYRHATGLEALFGYLYLCGDKERLAEIFAFILALCGRDKPGAKPAVSENSGRAERLPAAASGTGKMTAARRPA